MRFPLEPTHAARLLLLAAVRVGRLRVLGDVEGHPFHGNQWTQAKSVDADEVAVAQKLGLPTSYHGQDSERRFAGKAVDNPLPQSRVLTHEQTKRLPIMVTGASKTVEIDSLRSTQDYIQPSAVGYYKDGMYMKSQPIVATIHGEEVLLNGNHNVLAAKLRGEKTISVQHLGDFSQHADYIKKVDHDLRIAGDVVGHPFHGNQWTTSIGGEWQNPSPKLASEISGKTPGEAAIRTVKAFYVADRDKVDQILKHGLDLDQAKPTSTNDYAITLMTPEKTAEHFDPEKQTILEVTVRGRLSRQHHPVPDAKDAKDFTQKMVKRGLDGQFLNAYIHVHNPKAITAIREVKTKFEAAGDVVGHPFHGNQWTTGQGGAHHELRTPADAVEGVLAGEKVNIAESDVHAFLKKSTKVAEPVDLTNVHVEGHLIFGGEGLNIAREDMPQIPKEMRDQFLSELREQGVTAKREMVDPFDLRPTQKEISSQNVYAKLQKYEKDPERAFPPILAAKDGHILDGHHHWGMMATVRLDHPAVKMPVHRLSVGVREALKMMHAFDKKHGIKREAIKAAGDYEGHPFHGNQWTDGGGAASRGERSWGHQDWTPETVVSWYQQHGHLTINHHLRGESHFVGQTRKDADQAVQAMDTAFKQYGKTLKEPRSVYRGVAADQEVFDKLSRIKTGQIIADKAYLSTSTSEPVASEASGYDRHVVFTFQLPKGQRYLSGRRDEKEMILPRSMKMKVVKVEKDRDAKSGSGYLYVTAKAM